MGLPNYWYFMGWNLVIYRQSIGLFICLSLLSFDVYFPLVLCLRCSPSGGFGLLIRITLPHPNPNPNPPAG